MAGRRGAGRGRGGRRAQNDDLDRDFEIQELKRQVQELQEQLDQRNLCGSEDERSSGSAEGENPFHQDPSQSSGSEDAPPRHPRRIQNRRPDFDIKVDIPDFEGRSQPDEFIDWLHTVERIFDLKDVAEHRRVKIAAVKLRKRASSWWEKLLR